MSSFPEKERLDAAYDLRKPDRTPTIAGWIADPGKIMALTGVTEDEYWADPIPISVRAYQILEVDGILDVNVPGTRGTYTLYSHKDMQERASYESPEVVKEEIEKLPSPEQVYAEFDLEKEYQKRCADMKRMQALCGDHLYWSPAAWDVIPNFEWYRVWGYENYLMTIALYREHIIRLFKYAGAVAHCQAQVVARMVKEGLHPKAMLAGVDICGRNGPMVAPGFLREHYFPLVKRAIEPLREVGAKVVWHCDGDIRPILDDLLNLGLGGLQGFQFEFGVRLEDIVERRTVDGEPLIIFGPISVTRTLVQEKPEGVKRAVREAIRICEGKASLVLSTSNEILPDVPLENMVAMYEAAREG